MKNKNTSAGFALVEGIIIFAVIVIIGAGGWYVYAQRADNNKGSNQNQSSDNGSKKSEVLSLEIPELGLKINDPDSRGLTLEKVVVGSTSDIHTVYAVTSSDYKSEYKAICEHPSYLIETTAEDTSSNAKRIGDKYYEIGKTVQGCGGSVEMSKFIDELHTYILNNITTLKF